MITILRIVSNGMVARTRRCIHDLAAVFASKSTDHLHKLGVQMEDELLLMEREIRLPVDILAIRNRN